MEATQKTLQEIYSIVTDRIIEHLEKRVGLWKRPWAKAECIKQIGLIMLVKIDRADQANRISDGTATEKPRVIAPIPECETVIAGMPKQMAISRDVGIQPKYCQGLDEIIMPPMNLFNSSESYYEVLFHEAIHWSGHESRLNRKEFVQMYEVGSEPYAVEELTAEVGACYLMSFCGFIEKDITNNVAYIKEWLRALKKDRESLLYAITKAQEATDYLLSDFVMNKNFSKKL